MSSKIRQRIRLLYHFRIITVFKPGEYLIILEVYFGENTIDVEQIIAKIVIKEKNL